MTTNRHPAAMSWVSPFLGVMVGILGLCSSATAAEKSPAAAPNKAAATKTASAIDPKLVGVWGIDAKGGYEFRADGTFIMEGAVTYRFDAADGVWHYWMPSMEMAKTAAEYKLSSDGKKLEINLKKGTAMTKLIKIK